MMAIVAVEKTIKAPLEKVWAIAGDFTKCPVRAWPLEVINPGNAAKGGVGCERLVRDGKMTYHERLETIDPPHSLTYVMLSGAPLKRYIGKVELDRDGEYTRVKWTVDIAPKIPGTGWIVNMISRKNCNLFLAELEESTAG